MFRNWPISPCFLSVDKFNWSRTRWGQQRGHFPSDDAASKLIWLALRNITADWGRVAKDWKEAMNQFSILYADRFNRKWWH